MKEQEKIDRESKEKIIRSMKMEQERINSKKSGNLNISRRTERSGSKEKLSNVSKSMEKSMNISKHTDNNQRNESRGSIDKSKDRPPRPKKINYIDNRDKFKNKASELISSGSRKAYT